MNNLLDGIYHRFDKNFVGFCSNERTSSVGWPISLEMMKKMKKKKKTKKNPFIQTVK